MLHKYRSSENLEELGHIKSTVLRGYGNGLKKNTRIINAGHQKLIYANI